MSKKCKVCQIWNKKKGSPEYDVWKTEHKCSINHKGSAGSVESAGAIEIFQQSINNHKLRYNNYIGDGDSSSFNKVVQSKPYGETFIINKLECVGHIQKRLGCRLRTLGKTYKGKKISVGKGISGKGRLTDRAINLLQNYFGMAITQNSDVPAMKKAIGAVLFHCSESECDEQRHLFCPRTENSWCKWQSDQIAGKETYKTKISLPSVIKTLIKPIFINLGYNSLLEKCLHHKTQKSLNCLIWNRFPKSVYCSNKNK